MNLSPEKISVFRIWSWFRIPRFTVCSKRLSNHSMGGALGRPRSNLRRRVFQSKMGVLFYSPPRTPPMSSFLLVVDCGSICFLTGRVSEGLWAFLCFGPGRNSEGVLRSR